MKLLIEDITDEGLSVEVSEMPSAFESSFKDSPFTVAGPVKGTLTVRRFDSLIDVSGEIVATIKAECSRCLKSFDIEVKAELSSRLVKGSVGGGETQLRSGDMDITYFTGDELDIHDIVAEQILLELPYKPICDDGCKGLCPLCGRDLNNGPCKCEVKDAADPRFAKLKGFKVK